jgi:hypothetical protein
MKDAMNFQLKLSTPINTGRIEMQAEEFVEILQSKWVHPFKLQIQIVKRTPDGLTRAPNFAEWKAKQRESRK